MRLDKDQTQDQTPPQALKFPWGPIDGAAPFRSKSLACFQVVFRKKKDLFWGGEKNMKCRARDSVLSFCFPFWLILTLPEAIDSTLR